MTISELNPCPFCGEDAVIHSQDSGVCACDNQNCNIYLVFFEIKSWQTRPYLRDTKPVTVDGKQAVKAVLDLYYKDKTNTFDAPAYVKACAEAWLLTIQESI